MSDWQSVCIGDIANIPKKQPVANPQAIELLTVRLYAKGVERTGKYPRATERGRPYFARDAGEILIGRQNFHNSGIGIVSKADHGLICSNAITSLIPTDRADKNFLFYLLSSSEFRKSIQKQSEGTGQSEISETKILSLELALPPLPEQKKIAEILSGIDDLTQAIERKINKLNDTRREISRDIFSEFSVACLSQDCTVLSLEHACEAVIDCKNRTPPYTERGYPVIRTPNVRGGKLIFSDLRYTDKESYQIWTARSIPRAMDILFTREAPLGEACLIPHDFQCCLGQRMMLFRANRSLLDPQYLLFALMSPFVQEQLDRSKGGTTVGHARVADIKNIQIPIPPIENQIKIALSLGSIDASLQHSVQKKKKIQEKKNALASDLLSGRKRVSV